MATKKKAAYKKPEKPRGGSGPEHARGTKTSIAKKDIDSVAQKLQSFVKDLPQQEQDVLGWILTRAQAAPPGEMAAAAAAVAPDVPGLRTPLATQLARSVGFGVVAERVDVTVVVGWQYRFGLADSGDVVVNPAAAKKR